jgi:hypothetical protein
VAIKPRRELAMKFIISGVTLSAAIITFVFYLHHQQQLCAMTDVFNCFLYCVGVYFSVEAV